MLRRRSLQATPSLHHLQMRTRRVITSVLRLSAVFGRASSSARLVHTSSPAQRAHADSAVSFESGVAAFAVLAIGERRPRQT